MSEAESCSGKVAGDPNKFARHRCSRMVAQRSRAVSGKADGGVGLCQQNPSRSGMAVRHQDGEKVNASTHQRPTRGQGLHKGMGLVQCGQGAR